MSFVDKPRRGEGQDCEEMKRINICATQCKEKCVE